ANYALTRFLHANRNPLRLKTLCNRRARGRGQASKTRISGFDSCRRCHLHAIPRARLGVHAVTGRDRRCPNAFSAWNLAAPRGKRRAAIEPAQPRGLLTPRAEGRVAVRRLGCFAAIFVERFQAPRAARVAAVDALAVIPRPATLRGSLREATYERQRRNGDQSREEPKLKLLKQADFPLVVLERAKGFEPSTPTLARSCS